MTNYRVPQFLTILLILLSFLPLILVWINGRSSIYISLDSVESTSVAIVFGAGLTAKGAPSDALMDRLTVASQLYERGLVNALLVSGDNPTEDYNEPEVMKNTLIDAFAVPKELIFVDYAGRRTYDTCRRAHELWGIEDAILVTQGYHLPRAIWICESFGIQSAGISATLQPYVKQIPFKIREVGAIYKSFIDLYLFEPDYIAGESIQDLDP